MTKSEHVSSLGHQMSLMGVQGPGGFPVQWVPCLEKVNQGVCETRDPCMMRVHVWGAGEPVQ